MFHFIWILLKAGTPIAVTSFALVWWALRKDYLGGASTLGEYAQWKKADDQARKAEKKQRKAQRKAERRSQRAQANPGSGSATRAIPGTEDPSTGNPDPLAAPTDGATLSQELDPRKRKFDFLHSKWMEFGGGFYGVVAFYTYVLIEVGEVKDFLVGLGNLFNQGLVSLIINFFVQSIMNFITAITWPVYWLSRIHTEQWLWVIGAYGGYWLGARAAFRFNQRSSGQ